MYKFVYLLLFLLSWVLLPGCDLKLQESDSDILNEDPVRLTSGPSRKLSPAWSPDGKKIAYSSIIRSTELSTLPVVNGPIIVVGRVPRRIVASQFDVSPDATQLVYSEPSSGVLVVANFHDGSYHELTSTATIQPAWSRNGLTIAFGARNDAGNVNLWTISAFGGTATQITSEPGDELNPSWSPNGRQLVFEYNIDSLSVIKTIELASRGITQVTPDSVENRDPAWSPDGSQIAFASTRNETTAVWIRALDSGVEKRITELQTYANRPAWAEDGLRLAYRTREGICVSTTQAVPLNSIRTNQPYPVWMPGGNKLLITEVVDNAVIEVASLEDQTITEVTELSPLYSDLTPAWHPDSQTLVFARRLIDTFAFSQTLWRTTYPDGNPSPLFGSPERAGFEANPAISPDGTLLVFDNDFSIFLNLVGSQDVVNLAPFVGVDLREPAWAPKGHSFIANNGFRMAIFETDSSLVVFSRFIERNFHEPTWSSPHPIFGENIAAENLNGISIMQADGTSIRLVLRGAMQGSWSPDATTLAYIRDDQVHTLKIFSLLPE